MLRSAGFKVFTHRTCFGQQDQNISDPLVVKRCAKDRRVLITADADLEFMCGSEISASKVAIFVLSNNHEGPDKWGPRIIKAKEQILYELKRRKKPFVGHVGESGRVTKVRLYRGTDIQDIPLATYTGPVTRKGKKKQARSRKH